MDAALGASYSCVQLADIATKTVLSISKLYRKAKSVPESVRKCDEQLSSLIALVTFLQPCFDLPVHVTAHKDVTAVLEDCNKHALRLSRVIEDLNSHQNLSAWKRKLSAFKHIKKEEEIARISAQLEQHRNTLTLWIGAANQSVNQCYNVRASFPNKNLTDHH